MPMEKALKRFVKKSETINGLKPAAKFNLNKLNILCD